MQKEMKLVINFKKVRDTILSHKTLLLKVWIVTFVLSCILILPQPRYYITEVSVVPESVDTKALGQLGSMFSMSLMILLVLICSTKVSEKSDMAKS